MRTRAIGVAFDLVAVCADSFMPNVWSLEMSDIPHSSVVSRITVRKAAGAIRLETDGDTGKEFVRVRGEVWTPDGGALSVKHGQTFRVIKTFPPSPVGSRFDEKLAMPAADAEAVYLLARKEGASALRVGQTVPETSLGSYWLCGPARKSSEVLPDPLE